MAMADNQQQTGSKKYKIMFWNIQNIYEYKVTRPEEYDSTPTEDNKQAIKRFKKNRSQSVKLYENRVTNHRAFITQFISNYTPDIFVIVELSVGKVDLLQRGSLTHSVDDSYIAYDQFAPLQLLVSLNELPYSRKIWEAATSKVNASDIIEVAKEEGKITDITSKNTMFEQYAILWNPERLKIKRDPPNIYAPIRLIDQSAYQFPARQPGYVEFQDTNGNSLFSLIMHHSIYGKTLGPRRETIGLLADWLTSQEGEINNGLPLIIAGDFNLDYGTEEAAFQRLRQQGLHPRIGNQKTCPVRARNPLINAYDQIFTKGFTSNEEAGQAVNFVTEYCAGDYNKGKWISDHLPVLADVVCP